MKQNDALKLQERIAKEAAALLSLGGTAADTHLHERAIPLIGAAWGLPEETAAAQLALIREERNAVRRLESGEEAKHVLPEEEMLYNASGMETLELVWELFETALCLPAYEQRKAMFDTADELAAALGLYDWIEKAEGEEDILSMKTADVPA